jgi:hypothetical protein
MKNFFNKYVKIENYLMWPDGDAGWLPRWPDGDAGWLTYGRMVMPDG